MLAHRLSQVCGAGAWFFPPRGLGKAGPRIMFGLGLYDASFWTMPGLVSTCRGLCDS